MNSLAFALVLATALTAVSAGIDDIIDVHNGNANDYADEVRYRVVRNIIITHDIMFFIGRKTFQFPQKKSSKFACLVVLYPNNYKGFFTSGTFLWGRGTCF